MHCYIMHLSTIYKRSAAAAAAAAADDDDGGGGGGGNSDDGIRLSHISTYTVRAAYPCSALLAVL